MTTHVLLLTQDQTKRTLTLSRELSLTICQRLRHLGEEDDGEERGKRNLLISLRPPFQNLTHTFFFAA